MVRKPFPTILPATDLCPKMTGWSVDSLCDIFDNFKPGWDEGWQDLVTQQELSAEPKAGESEEDKLERLRMGVRGGVLIAKWWEDISHDCPMGKSSARKKVRGLEICREAEYARNGFAQDDKPTLIREDGFELEYNLEWKLEKDQRTGQEKHRPVHVITRITRRDYTPFIEKGEVHVRRSVGYELLRLEGVNTRMRKAYREAIDELDELEEEK